MNKITFDLIVPVFNEAGNLPAFFSRLKSLPVAAKVIFIDNGSTDGSLELLRTYEGATIIEHQYNEGYGASILDGIRAGKNTHIVIIDADCEYPPECIPALLKNLENHDVVYASRFLHPQSLKMPWIKAIGNKIITEAFNLFFHQQITDLYTGCKGFKRSCLNGLTLEQTGFEHVLELSAKLAARKYLIHEVPVTFTPRQAGQSKMRHLSETVKFFYWLLQYTRLSKTGKL